MAGRLEGRGERRIDGVNRWLWTLTTRLRIYTLGLEAARFQRSPSACKAFSMQTGITGRQ